MSFSNVEIEGKKAAPDRIYYNATVVNNTLSTIQQNDDPAIVFQDQRQNPLVPDASNYELSVQNFTLNGAPKTLPLFIPQICPAIIARDVTKVEVFPPNEGDQYKRVQYTCTNFLSVGQKINSVIGCGNNGIFDFVGPREVIACTPTTFTVYDYSGKLQVGSVVISPAGTATFQDPSDITTTIYTVTFGCNIGPNAPDYYEATLPIIWEPENRATYTVIPTTALPTQLETDYYYCYTYTHWIRLVNTALRNAWAISSAHYGTLCPWFEYDETTGLFSINQDSKTCMAPYGGPLPAPYSGITASTGSGYITGEYSFVGMNTCLESLLSNFNSTYFSYGKSWAGTATLLPEVVINMGLTVDLLTGNTGTNSPVGVSLRTLPKTSIFQLANPFTYTPIADAIFVRLVQDYISTGGIWSPIASFVLGTSQVPVRNEASANPITFGQANIGGNSSNSGAFQKVLIETPINALRADYWKGFIFYEPATLTYTSLDPSHDGVQDVDISLYWRNRLTNSLIPVRLPNQGSVSFRLLFKRKIML